MPSVPTWTEGTQALASTYECCVEGEPMPQVYTLSVLCITGWKKKSQPIGTWSKLCLRWAATAGEALQG